MSKYTLMLKAFVKMTGYIAIQRWWELSRLRCKFKFFHAGLTEHFMNIENGKVHYWVGGKGPPLVMIHGYGSEGILNWYRQVSAMAKEYSLVVPDMMWFGESSSDKEDYTIDFQAQAVIQLLEALGISRFHLMGHSHGGIVSAMLATMLPDRVQKIIIVDSPAVPTPVTEEERARVRREHGIESAVDLLLPETVADMRRIIALGYHNPPRVPSFILKAAPPYFRRNLKQRMGMANYIEDNVDNYFDNTGYNIRQEALVVWGIHDTLLPVEVGERIVSAIGDNAQLRIIQDTGHGPNLEKPKEFNRIVLDFLRET